MFQHMEVPDLNGAGIRLETGNLVVINSWFRDSQQGILTSDDPSASILIDHSTFSGLGRCDQGASCAHSIYIGNYGSLTVTHSRFERGNGGHYLKSRAARAVVTGNSFDDSHGHTTNYMIDLCAGSVGSITDNVFVQGKDKENHSAMITVAAEARIEMTDLLAHFVGWLLSRDQTSKRAKHLQGVLQTALAEFRREDRAERSPRDQ